MFVPDVCVLCSGHSESHQHLFLVVPLAFGSLPQLLVVYRANYHPTIIRIVFVYSL